MTTDETLYEEGQLVAKDITVKTYFPLPDGKLTIDLDIYYDGLCCFEVVAVESRMSEKTTGIFISYDRRRIVYEMQDLDHWSVEGANDTVQYVIKDTNTGQTAVGTILIQAMEQGAFVAKDVHLHFPLDQIGSSKWSAPEPLLIDVALINKLSGVTVVEVGDFDKRIFEQVAINTDKRSELVFKVAKECAALYGGKRTEVEYAIEAEVGGIVSVSKAKVVFQFVDGLFYAETIEVEMDEAMAAGIYIDLRMYNPNFADIALQSVDTDTPTARGTINSDIPSMGITYMPNMTSGFWDGPEAKDLIPYELQNNVTGQKAVGHIIIGKAETTTNSGSGIEAGTTLYVENSVGNTFMIDNLTPGAAAGVTDADLQSLDNLLLEGVAGSNSIAGGSISVSLKGTLGGSDVGVINIAPSSAPDLITRLNGVAEITAMQLFFLATAGSGPTGSWTIDLQATDPLSTERSEITFL